MSRRPGIAQEWFQKYWQDVFPSNEVPVPGVGVLKSVPRYYDEAMERIDGLLLDQVKEERQKYRHENAAEFSPERLMAKYKVKKAQVGQLKRTV